MTKKIEHLFWPRIDFRTPVSCLIRSRCSAPGTRPAPPSKRLLPRASRARFRPASSARLTPSGRSAVRAGSCLQLPAVPPAGTCPSARFRAYVCMRSMIYNHTARTRLPVHTRSTCRGRKIVSAGKRRLFKPQSASVTLEALFPYTRASKRRRPSEMIKTRSDGMPNIFFSNAFPGRNQKISFFGKNACIPQKNGVYLQRKNLRRGSGLFRRAAARS